MPHYLLQVTFNAEAMAKLVAQPENRLQSMIPVVESLGGTFVGSWLSFGEYDSVAVVEMPDNITAKAFSMAAMAGGSLTTFDVTPLMTFEDGIEAMRVAGTIDYRPPQA